MRDGAHHGFDRKKGQLKGRSYRSCPLSLSLFHSRLPCLVHMASLAPPPTASITRYCTHCGGRYLEHLNFGLLACRGHQAAFDERTQRWTCCGFRVHMTYCPPDEINYFNRDHARGCTRMDHDWTYAAGEAVWLRRWTPAAISVPHESIISPPPLLNDDRRREVVVMALTDRTFFEWAAHFSPPYVWLKKYIAHASKDTFERNDTWLDQLPQDPWHTLNGFGIDDRTIMTDAMTYMMRVRRVDSEKDPSMMYYLSLIKDQ